MHTPAIDVLFITQVSLPGDSGGARDYEPLRMRAGDRVAAVPVLRALARGGAESGAPPAAARAAAFGIPPVLTPIYLGEYLRRRGVHFENIACLETGEREIRAALDRGVRLIALSTTWLPIPRGAVHLRQAAARLRAWAPGIPIVAGGVGVRKGLRARALMREGRLPGAPPAAVAEEYPLIDAGLDQGIDAFVTAEGGEATLAAMVDRLRRNEDFRDLPNLAIPSASGYTFTPEQAEPSDLDGEIVDWRGHLDRIGPFDAPVRTAAGCPFQCEFCDFFGLHRPHLRSMESLVEELRTLSSPAGAPRRVFFADDNLAITRRRLVEFTRTLIRERLNLSWRTFIRADAVDAETAGLMRESGCRECFLGIESGDPAILANMNKRLDPDRALRAIESLDENGIHTQCTFVVGFPGECAGSIARTAAFISAMPSGDRARALQRYYLFRFQALPLSPITSPERRAMFGLTGIGDTWAHRTMNSEEARGAMRDLFLQVRGPSHMYLELLPTEWSVADARRVVEQRDEAQKEALRTGAPPRLDTVLAAVRAAEAAAKPPAAG